MTDGNHGSKNRKMASGLNLAAAFAAGALAPARGSRMAKLVSLVCLGALIASFPARAADPDPDPERSEIWIKIKASLFANRAIRSNTGEVIQLEAPTRAEDAATVPISIKTRLPQSTDAFIKKIYLIIDKNPSPIGAVFHLTPDTGRADLETRIRIEEYSHIRVIAEMNDGQLFMSSRYIKASGGCSAPAGKDRAAALPRLGKMRIRLDNEVAYHRPNLAQLMISHPNDSGLAMDQLTRLYVPAHFVRNVSVTFAGKPILTAEVDFSISENPNFRFYFVPRGPGELKAEVLDTKELRFDSSIEIRSPATTPSRARGN